MTQVVWCDPLRTQWWLDCVSTTHNQKTFSTSQTLTRAVSQFLRCFVVVAAAAGTWFGWIPNIVFQRGSRQEWISQRCSGLWGGESLLHWNAPRRLWYFGRRCCLHNWCLAPFCCIQRYDIASTSCFAPVVRWYSSNSFYFSSVFSCVKWEFYSLLNIN